jgi:anthranilate synthase
MRPESYSTPGGIVVTRTISKVPYSRGLRDLLKKLDTQRGIYLSSGYEYPERYSRWDIAALGPPLEIIAAGRDVVFRPLSERGLTLVKILEPLLVLD